MANDNLDAKIVLHIDDSSIVKESKAASKTLSNSIKLKPKTEELKKSQEDLRKYREELVNTRKEITNVSKTKLSQLDVIKGVNAQREAIQNLSKTLANYRKRQQLAVDTGRSRDADEYAKKIQAGEQSLIRYNAQLKQYTEMLRLMKASGKKEISAFDLGKASDQLTQLSNETAKAVEENNAFRASHEATNAAIRANVKAEQDLANATSDLHDREEKGDVNNLEQQASATEQLATNLKDADKNAEELHESLEKGNVNELNEEVQTVTNNLEKAKAAAKESIKLNLNANVAKMEYADLIQYIDKLKARLSEIRKNGIPEEQKEEFTKITNKLVEAEQAAKDYVKAIKDANKVKPEPIKIDLNADVAKMNIAELVRYMQQLKAAQKEIEGQGMPIARDAEYQQITDQLVRTQRAITVYKKEIDNVRQSEQASVSTKRRFIDAMRDMTFGVKEAKGALKTLSKTFSKIKSEVNSLSNSLRRSLKHGFTNLVKYVFGFRSLFFLVRRLRKFISEGLENLARYNDKISEGVKSHNLYNDAMNDLQTSLLYLKNAWAAAFAPIVIKVMPILTGLIDYLAAVGNAIAQLIAQLTGQETAYNAIKVQAQDYADSLDNSSDSAKKATKSAKKLQQQLASYDKLDVIKSNDDDDSSPSGSGGGGSNPYTPKVQDMFKTVKPLSDLATIIQTTLDTGDWEGLGDRVATNVANAFDSIPWPTIQAKVQQGATATADFINGFLGNAHLWTSGGTAAAQALNTVSLGIKTFNDTINPVLIGYNASLGFRTFLLETNWGQLGNAIGGFFTNVNKGLTTFLHNMPTQDVVDSIMGFINGLNLPQVVQTTLTLALTGIVTLVKLGGQFIGTAGYDLGLKLAAAVSEVHMDKYTLYDDDGNPIDEIELPIKPTVDWSEHPVLALLFAGSDYSAKILIDVMTGGNYAEVQNLWDNWPEWLSFEGMGENVVKSFQALFEFDWLFGDGSAESGFFGAKGIVTWLKEDVIDLDSLAVWWNNSFLAEWFGEMDRNTGKISKKKTTGGAATGGGLGSMMKLDYSGLTPSQTIFNQIKTTWENIKKFIADPVGSIRTAVENAKKFINEKFDFENVRSKVATKWNEIRDKFAEKLQKIRDKVESAKKFINEKMNFENVRKSVAEKWETIKGYFAGDNSYITKIKNAIDKSDFITNLKNLFTDPKGTIKDAINKLLFGYDKQAAKTGWQSTQKVHVKGIVDYFEDSFAGIVKFIKDPINTALDSIGTFINNIIKGINNLSGAVNNIKISGTNPFTGKSYSYGFNIPKISEIKMPKLAQGAVIPPNKEFMAVLGDQKQGVNIETPLDTMVEAFEKALDKKGGANNREPIVLQLEGRTIAKVVWNEEEKKYKQTGFGLAY